MPQKTNNKKKTNTCSPSCSCWHDNVCAIKQRRYLRKVVRDMTVILSEAPNTSARAQTGWNDHLNSGTDWRGKKKNKHCHRYQRGSGRRWSAKFILMFIYTLYSSLIIVTSLSPHLPRGHSQKIRCPWRYTVHKIRTWKRCKWRDHFSYFSNSCSVKSVDFRF